MRDHPEKEMEPGKRDVDLGVFMEAVMEDGKGWIEAQKDYAILIVGERLGKVAGMLTSTIVVLLFVGSTLLLGSVSLAIWLGGMVGGLALGFLYVAGLHLAITLLFVVFGRKPVRDRIMLHVLNATLEDEED